MKNYPSIIIKYSSYLELCMVAEIIPELIRIIHSSGSLYQKLYLTNLLPEISTNSTD